MQSDDGSTKCIIVIGGLTDEGPDEKVLRTSEILDLENREWVQGPELPLGLENSACIAIPPTYDFACVVVGGWSEEETEEGQIHSSNICGLKKSLSEWKVLGKIKRGRSNHITLPLSYWLVRLIIGLVSNLIEIEY